MNDLEKRIASIEARNKKVEQDKAWETSWTRRLTIGVLTYVAITVYLIYVGNNKPFINALVPTVGFELSTLVLPQIKTIWQNLNK